MSNVYSNHLTNVNFYLPEEICQMEPVQALKPFTSRKVPMETFTSSRRTSWTIIRFGHVLERSGLETQDCSGISWFKSEWFSERIWRCTSTRPTGDIEIICELRLWLAVGRKTTCKHNSWNSAICFFGRHVGKIFLNQIRFFIMCLAKCNGQKLNSVALVTSEWSLDSLVVWGYLGYPVWGLRNSRSTYLGRPEIQCGSSLNIWWSIVWTLGGLMFRAKIPWNRNIAFRWNHVNRFHGPFPRGKMPLFSLFWEACNQIDLDRPLLVSFHGASLWQRAALFALKRSGRRTSLRLQHDACTWKKRWLMLTVCL